MRWMQVPAYSPPWKGVLYSQVTVTRRRVARNLVWREGDYINVRAHVEWNLDQKEFRRIKGYRHMGALVHALRSKQKSLDSDEFAA